MNRAKQGKIDMGGNICSRILANSGCLDSEQCIQVANLLITHSRYLVYVYISDISW